MSKIIYKCLIAMLCGLSGSFAIAQEHNDIEFTYQDGKLVLEGGAATTATSDAHRIFEGNFPTSGVFERFTDDPGFVSELAEGLGVDPFDLIGGDVIQSTNFGSYLTYFDPMTGVIASTDATITIVKGPESLDVTDSMGGLFTVGQADSSGDLHEHVDFYLSDGAELGAYGLLFDLTTDNSAYDNSEPIWLVFNYGMDEAVFDDEALAAFGKASTVPEPTTTVILGVAALGLTLTRRRRLLNYQE